MRGQRTRKLSRNRKRLSSRPNAFINLIKNVVKCEDMKREEFTAKEILDEWKCFVCLQEKPDLEVFAEDAERIYLICESCRKRNENALHEDIDLLGL